MLTQGVGKYRHVIFSDAINGSGRALDFGLGPLQENADLRGKSALTADENTFVRWVLRKADLDSGNYRDETLHRRLQACLRTCRAASVQQAKAILQRQPELLAAALGSLLIGVTGFFRDAGVFEYLRQRVLPRLARRPVIRVWSTACSDGAELYSVAILLAEIDALRRAMLLGTDCRSDATRRAENAVFDPSTVQSLPQGMLGKYFLPHPPGWKLRDEVRRACQWRRGDMLTITEPGQWDLILCRNVTMYLKPSAAAGLWERLVESLSPGGVLVVGKAERPVGIAALNNIAPCVYRRERS